MATTRYLVAIFLCLCVLSMVYALPVVQDLQPSDIKLTKDVKMPENFVHTPLISLIRGKRQVIRGNGCPEGKIYFKNVCMDFERYETIINGDYDT